MLSHDTFSIALPGGGREIAVIPTPKLQLTAAVQALAGRRF